MTSRLRAGAFASTSSTRLCARRGGFWSQASPARRCGREDACAALMEAQLGAGQRAAAIDTYLSCRRYLVEELGIDPSPSIVALYRSAVEAEEALE